MKLLLAVATLAACHVAGAVAVPAPRATRALVEAPSYEVVSQHEGFEERLYPAARWATTSMEGPALFPLRYPLWKKLDDYIKGGNEQNETWRMTTPITVLVEPLSSSADYAFTMGFYLPEEQQEEAPAGGEDIVLEDRPEMTVYTRRFGGYATDDVIAMEAQELRSLIEADGITDVDFDSFYVASYRPPLVAFNRRNEVWYFKTTSVKSNRKSSVEKREI